MWQVILTPEAEKNLAKLPHNFKEKFINIFKEIAIDPFLGKPLRGDLAGRFSARVGDYRALYRKRNEKHEIWILYIRHRKDVYR